MENGADAAKEERTSGDVRMAAANGDSRGGFDGGVECDFQETEDGSKFFKEIEVFEEALEPPLQHFLPDSGVASGVEDGAATELGLSVESLDLQTVVHERELDEEEMIVEKFYGAEVEGQEGEEEEKLDTSTQLFQRHEQEDEKKEEQEEEKEDVEVIVSGKLDASIDCQNINQNFEEHVVVVSEEGTRTCDECDRVCSKAEGVQEPMSIQSNYPISSSEAAGGMGEVTNGSSFIVDDKELTVGDGIKEFAGNKFKFEEIERMKLDRPDDLPHEGPENGESLEVTSDECGKNNDTESNEQFVHQYGRRQMAITVQSVAVAEEPVKFQQLKENSAEPDDGFAPRNGHAPVKKEDGGVATNGHAILEKDGSSCSHVPNTANGPLKEDKADIHVTTEKLQIESVEILGCSSSISDDNKKNASPSPSPSIPNPENLGHPGFLSRPAGLGSSVPLLEPSARSVQQAKANGSAPRRLSQPSEEPPAADGEVNDETHEKLQMIRVKFLRLAHRLGQTPHNVVVAQVLYRLGLAEQLKRNTNRPGVFSFDRASVVAEQLEAAGRETLDFSCTIMRSHVVQQAIRQAAGDVRLMNPVSLVENHSACRMNRAGQRVLPNGQVWKPQLLLLSFASKILAEANMLLKLQDSPPGKPFGSRPRVPPLPFLLSSLLQSRPQLKLPGEQFGDDDNLDEDVDGTSDSDEGSDYDELPPFKPLTRSQLAKLSKLQKKAYFEELDYRERLFYKKQLKEEKRRENLRRKWQIWPRICQVGMVSGFFEPMACQACAGFLGWDHDIGYEGLNVERVFAIKDKIPMSVSGQLTKDKKECSLQMEVASSIKHSESKATSLCLDMQTVGKDIAYITWCNNTAAGVSVTVLGDSVSAGLKFEDKLTISKRFRVLLTGGAMAGRGDVAYGGRLEATLRDKGYPIGRALSTLALSIVDSHGDLQLGCNLQSQLPLGRGTNFFPTVARHMTLQSSIVNFSHIEKLIIIPSASPTPLATGSVANDERVQPHYRTTCIAPNPPSPAFKSLPPSSDPSQLTFTALRPIEPAAMDSRTSLLPLFLASLLLLLLSPPARATIVPGSIERTTKQQILASIPPHAAEAAVPFLTSPSGKYTASLVRRQTAPGAGGLGNDFCYIQVQDTGAERSMWESECGPVSSANTCAAVFTAYGLQVFDGSNPVWTPGRSPPTTTSWRRWSWSTRATCASGTSTASWRGRRATTRARTRTAACPALRYGAGCAPFAVPIGGDNQNLPFGQPAPSAQQQLLPPQSNTMYDQEQPQHPFGGASQAFGFNGHPLVDNTPYDSGCSGGGAWRWIGFGVPLLLAILA
ncbi:Translocase of chloroplast [Musa troglodytarum]|uniref:Translocase of chloroplast n=1 Tax=Musa troglodytarum TaxID=320322 RepID=A0A9E7JDQ8_9LILI|nr:Translocase of chloroplast [Musa troglodytarum]